MQLCEELPQQMPLELTYAQKQPSEIFPLAHNSQLIGREYYGGQE